MMKTLLLLALWAAAGLAQANDAAQHLQEVLARFKNQSPLKAQLLLKSESQGQGENRSGRVQLPLEDGPQGLRLLYPQNLLLKAEQEEAAKDKDDKTPTPTATGLQELGLSDLRDMARAADSLQRRLQGARFKAERSEPWQGQPARKLSFEVDKARPNKYVKDYSGVLEVWVNEQGVPLASRMQQKASGRFMVVIGFDFSSEDESHYLVQGDRLLAVQRLSKSSGSGGGEAGSGSRQLQLIL